MNAIELKAGPELDAAVAAAINAKVESGVDRYGMANVVLKELGIAFSPSTDLNAAFAAAHKCEWRWADYHGRPMSEKLFERCYLGQYQDGWAIYDQDYTQMEAIAIGPTPEVAICRAILKLKAS